MSLDAYLVSDRSDDDEQSVDGESLVRNKCVCVCVGHTCVWVTHGSHMGVGHACVWVTCVCVGHIVRTVVERVSRGVEDTLTWTGSARALNEYKHKQVLSLVHSIERAKRG